MRDGVLKSYNHVAIVLTALRAWSRYLLFSVHARVPNLISGDE